MQKRTFGRHLDLADVSIQPDFPTGTHHCLLPSCSAPLSPWVVCSPPSQAEAPGGQEWLSVHLHCAPVACSPDSSFCLTITWEDRGEERRILSFHRRGDRGPDGESAAPGRQVSTSPRSVPDTDASSQSAPQCPLLLPLPRGIPGGLLINRLCQ